MNTGVSANPPLEFDRIAKAGDVNAHTHLYSGLAPLGLPALNPAPQHFIEILERLWWRLDRAIDEGILYESARYAIACALINGTAALFDHHESPNFIEGSLDILADACQELGIRALLCYGATERNGGRPEARRGLLENERFLKSNRRPLVRGLIGVHAGFTVSDETLREAGDLCRDLNTALHIHVAEDQIDVIDSQERGYAGPLFRLRALGALVPGSIVAHGIHLSDEQVKMAENEGVWLVQNPRSNENNRVGYPKALRHSTKVALGTDGFPSNMRDEQSALFRNAKEQGDNIASAERRLEAGHELLAAHFGHSAMSDQQVLIKKGENQWDVHSVHIADRMVVEDGRLVTANFPAVEAAAMRAAVRLWTKMEAISVRKMETI